GWMPGAVMTRHAGRRSTRRFPINRVASLCIAPCRGEAGAVARRSIDQYPSIAARRVPGGPDAITQRTVGVAGNARSCDVVVEQLLQCVVAGHLVFLAALLMQAHPAAPALDEIEPAL